MTRSRISRIGLVIVLIAAVFCVGWVTSKQPTSGGWEYEIVEFHAPHSHAKAILDQRGEYGWELVSTSTVPKQ